VLNQTLSLKDVWDSGGTAPRILNFSTRLRWVKATTKWSQ